MYECGIITPSFVALERNSLKVDGDVSGVGASILARYVGDMLPTRFLADISCQANTEESTGYQ